MNRYSALLAIMLLLCPAVSFSACRVHEGSWNGLDAVILENDLVRVSILPGNSGRICEYYLKKYRINQFLPFYLKEKIPIGDILFSINNYGGYKDIIVQEGIFYGDRLYTWEIQKDTPEEATVVVRREDGDKRIERSVTIFDNQPFLKVQVTITPKQDGYPINYWVHTWTHPGGEPYYPEKLTVYAPIRNAVGEGTLKKETLGLFPGVKGLGEPAQPWLAVVNTKKNIMLAERFPLSQVGKNPIMYVNVNKGKKEDTAAGMEIQFGNFEGKKGGSINHEITYYTIPGLSQLDYLTDYFAIDVSPKEKNPFRRNAKNSITLTVSPSRNCPAGLVLVVYLKNGQARPAVASLTLPRLTFGNIVKKTILISGAVLQPGMYGMEMELKKGGTTVETFQLLDVQVVVK